MGIFSGKTKTYVGISSSRMYETGDIPNSIKDSTAGYISDIGQGLNNGFYITDYNRLAIEESVVMKMKKAYRYANKDTSNHVKYISNEVALINPADIGYELTENILDTLKVSYPNASINYLEYDYLDYAHIVKVALDKEYNWNSYNNSMNFDGLNGWLDSVDFYLSAIQEEESFGDSFVSGETAIRTKDPSRPFNSFNYEENIKDNFVVKFMPKYSKSVVQTNKTYKDKTLDEIILEEEEEEVISDDKPISESSTTYGTNIISETTNIYDDPNDSNIEITEIIKSISELSYGSIKEETRYFSEFINVLPSDLPVIDGESATPEITPPLADYISEVNDGNEVNDNLDGNVIIFLSINLDGNTNKHFTISDYEYGGLEGEIAEVMRNLIYSEQVTDYIPPIHIKVNGKALEEGDAGWKENKLYAKRWGIKLNGLYEDITEGMENDIDKVRHAYIQFGVNVTSQNQLEIKYIYDYFIDQLDGNNKIYDKIIELKTTTTRDRVSWKYVVINTVDYAIEDEYANDSSTIRLPLGGKTITFISVYKRISDTQCLNIIVYRYSRECNVTDSKSGVASKDEITLLPLNYKIMKESIKGFINKEHFLYRCMYVEFLTYVEVKQKWYQTGAFKALAIIAGAAIVFYTGGAGSYLSALLVSAATSYAIEVAIKIAVDVFGPKYAKYIAYALIAVSLGKGAGGMSSASAAGANIVKILSAFSMQASFLLSIGNQLLTQSTQALGAEREEEMAEKNRELEAFKRQTEVLLGSRVNDDDSYTVGRDYISPYITLGSIEDITNQFLDLNKIDTCVQYIHNYVEYLISVPTLEDSALSILGKS